MDSSLTLLCSFLVFEAAAKKYLMEKSNDDEVLFDDDWMSLPQNSSWAEKGKLHCVFANK